MARTEDFPLQLARRALDDPGRLTELEQAMNDRLTELVAEATDAGYSTIEALEAMSAVVSNQYAILREDPDPADDPA